MSWLILAFVIPIFVAWQDGTTYSFALSLMGAGGAMYFTNIFLIRFFISRRAPSTLIDGTWERTAGRRIVPKWVSVLGLVGMGFVPSGAIVALLLYVGYLVDRG